MEGEVGRFRRNHLVPVPSVRARWLSSTLMLRAGCEADCERRIVGRQVTVGEAWALERPLLRTLPGEPFDASETAAPRVDAKSLVTVRQNRYSVPVALAGLRVAVRIGAREITISHAGKVVARHERLHGRFGTSATLDHYLELLQRKPGGLERSLPLAQTARPRRLAGRVRRALGRARLCGTGARRPHGRWSTCSCSPASTGPTPSPSPSGARSPPAPTTAALSPCSPAAPTTAKTRPDPLSDLDARLAAHDRPAPGLDRVQPADRRQPVTVNAKTAALEALIEAHAIELKLPTVRRRFRALAAEATREQQTPVAYLGALLEAEIAERAERRERRRLIDARFPALKRLEEFRFTDNPKVPQATIAALAEGSWIDDRESVILIGDSGTGKTHLATALAICACQQGRRVRFTTLAGLANELQEADSPAASSPASSDATPAPNSSSSTNSATSPSPKAPPNSSSRSSPNATNAAASSSRPTCPSVNGRKSSTTPGSPRQSSTGSPTEPTSSTPAPTPGASTTASPTPNAAQHHPHDPDRAALPPVG